VAIACTRGSSPARSPVSVPRRPAGRVARVGAGAASPLISPTCSGADAVVTTSMGPSPLPVLRLRARKRSAAEPGHDRARHPCTYRPRRAAPHRGGPVESAPTFDIDRSIRPRCTSSSPSHEGAIAEATCDGSSSRTRSCSPSGTDSPAHGSTRGAGARGQGPAGPQARRRHSVIQPHVRRSVELHQPLRRPVPCRRIALHGGARSERVPAPADIAKELGMVAGEEDRRGAPAAPLARRADWPLLTNYPAGRSGRPSPT
jgi:hypothetical protein